MGGARPPRRHGAKGGAEEMGDLIHPIRDGVPFGQRREQRLLVHLRQGVAPPTAYRNVRGDGQDCNRTFVRLQYARKNVASAAAAWPLADPDLARHPGIGVGHIGGVALIAGQDVVYPVPFTLQGVIEGKAGVAAKAKNVLNAMGLQHAKRGFGAGHGRHGALRLHRISGRSKTLPIKNDPPAL